MLPWLGDGGWVVGQTSLDAAVKECDLCSPSPDFKESSLLSVKYVDLVKSHKPLKKKKIFQKRKEFHPKFWRDQVFCPTHRFWIRWHQELFCPVLQVSYSPASTPRDQFLIH